MIPSLVLSVMLMVSPTSSEWDAAHSTDAADRRGFEPSLYRGDWYSPKWREVRKCIMWRESRYVYTVRNKYSSAQGAYQFLDSKWRDSLVWMMLEESNNTNDFLRSDIRALRNKPIAKWSRYFQDRAFYTAWQHGKGKAHWYHDGINCF